MKSICFALLLMTASSALAFDESFNFQPGLNLFNEAAQLTDLMGTHGSQLCSPISITHGMQYLRANVGFSSLAPVADLDGDGTIDTYKDRIRYFFATCGTDRETGTHYQQTETCMADYIRASGYKPWVYMVGPHAVDAPENVPLSTMQHPVSINDVRSYLKQKLMVIMAVGWYDFDPATNSYKRIGGHFFNLYGYNWDNAWGESQMQLIAVNSLQSYNAVVPYDLVQMTAVPADGTTYPSETKFIITGPGFYFTQKTLVEDIFVAWPLAP
jgi:hypothetical protein